MRRVPRAFRSITVFVLSVLMSHGSEAYGDSPCWMPPIVGVVADPFRRPPCPYCAGNRGIEFDVAAGRAIRAVAAGTVEFAGNVAGTRYVVVRHPNGWRATYGRLAAVSVSTGDAVLTRQVLGESSSSFHFGLRIGNTYVDPAPHVGVLVGRRRLVPLDGTAPRATPAPRLRCAATGGDGVVRRPRPR